MRNNYKLEYCSDLINEENGLLILIRGSAGSGKSTLAKSLAKKYSHVKICEADQYFETENGYVFDREKLGEAHKSCFSSFVDVFSKKNSVCIVSNTNIKHKDMKLYIDYCIDRNIQYKVYVMTEQYTSIHNVPEDVILNMKRNLKPFDINYFKTKNYIPRKSISSDLHFGHKNIFKFCTSSRAQFSDVEDMNNKLILEWNSHIKDPRDIMYHLGDFSFLNIEQTINILRKLHGVKRFIVGNHDNRIIKFLKNNPELLVELNIEWVKDYHIETIHNDKLNFSQTITMCHYGMTTWYNARYKGIMFYGHIHQHSTDIPGSLNVGFDRHCKILTMEEAMKYASDTIDTEYRTH